MKKIILFSIILGIFNMQTASAADINSCSILSTPGETYLLTADVDETYPFTHGDPACFSITASNITLDCQGHTITTQSSGYWLDMRNQSGVTIKNCVANEAGELLISYSDYNYIIDNTIIGSYCQGIYLHVSSDYNTVQGNTLISNECSGIFSYSGAHNTITDNTILSNGDGGIRLGTNSDSVDNNIACYNDGTPDDMKDINALHGDATGDENTCDTTFGFDDTGTTGCTYSCPDAGCGNNILELGEECDDGNNTDGDGCSAGCQVESEDLDGDGVADETDACPNSDLSPAVTIESCDSEVPNILLQSGCTI